ncbi:MAG: IS4 family transposase [Parabacteroides sp.]|nr:IS4 family transposase [Parabacteroides sp.]
MAQVAYIFNQLCSLLPRDHFEYLVKKHEGNSYMKTYSCWNHFLVMLWAQLTGRESLRDIESSLRAHKDKLYRLGMGKNISRNNLSHANATREVSIYRDFAQKVMNITLSQVGTEEKELFTLSDGFNLSGLFAVDSSTVYLDLTKFNWSVPQRGRGGIKLHTLYDILREVPVLCLITGHEERDQTFMENYPYRKGGMYVFDKAYIKTASMKEIDSISAYFVVRRKRGMSYSVIKELTAAVAPIYGDKEISFSNRWARKGYPGNLRLVQYYSMERNEVLDFLTNNFQLPAMTIAESYRNRWNIELFFRWIKQHLYVTRFYGTSANAVSIQIYVAVSAYCLVALAKALYGFKGTTYELLRVLSVSLFERQPLKDVLDRYGDSVKEEANQSYLWPSLFDDVN